MVAIKDMEEIPSCCYECPYFDDYCNMLLEILSHSGTGEEVIQAYADGLMKGLDILDKCKAESEAEE